MNELQTQSQQLPDTLEDLTQFVLVGKAKLQAYMLKLQTVNRLSVAQEIRDQTLQEAQESSTALIAAEQRIGEILLSIPKASGGDRKSDDFKNGNSANFEKTKSETASEMGYSHNEVRDYQQMAKNPEIVQKIIEEAIANGEIVTKSQVMKEIKTERDKAKAEMQDLREERDYLQSQVEEPEQRSISAELTNKKGSHKAAPYLYALLTAQEPFKGIFRAYFNISLISFTLLFSGRIERQE